MALLGQTRHEPPAPSHPLSVKGLCPAMKHFLHINKQPTASTGNRRSQQIPGLGELGQQQQRRVGARCLKGVVGRGAFVLPPRVRETDVCAVSYLVTGLTFVLCKLCSIQGFCFLGPCVSLQLDYGFRKVNAQRSQTEGNCS